MATVTLGAKRPRESEDTEHDTSPNRNESFPQLKKAKRQAELSAPKYRKSAPLQTRTIPALQSVDVTTEDVALSGYISLQIITGSYDRGILYGFTAEIPSHTLEPAPANQPQKTNGSKDERIKFSDSFLFTAHSSSIRCLDVSGPSDTGKRILATGSSDERINLYTLSTAAPSHSSHRTEADKASLLKRPTSSQSPKNRSLGNLLHHDRAVTRLQFPSNSNKLFSGSEDNNIAITRVRDWTLLSSIRAPVPKPTGRPSGDTAAPGEVPAGINDFAIHPSQKLMLSVGRGEKCLRLWNLMTGKKAGVLNFDREVLARVGEGKHSSGEGRRVVWSGDGEVYVVFFERGTVVYGLDSKARAVMKSSPPAKLHQVRMLPKLTHLGREVLAVSTEDGRVLFFDAYTYTTDTRGDGDEKTELPSCKCIAQLGGRASGLSGRIKDFEILPLSQPGENSDAIPSFLVVTASSDGAVRIWNVLKRDLQLANDANGITLTEGDGLEAKTPKQIGTLVGTLETGNRITCLGAFVMDEKHGGEVTLEMEEDERVDGPEILDGESEIEGWDGFDEE